MTIDNLIIGKRYSVSSNNDCVITDTATGYTLASISAGTQAVIVPISESITSDKDCVVLPIDEATVMPGVGQGGNGGDTGNSYVMWGGENNTEVTLNIPDSVDIPLSFYSTNVTKVSGTGGGITNCSNMCYYCASLTALTLNLPSASDCNAMCYGCSSLTSLTLDLPSATNCNAMCYGCSSLTEGTLKTPLASDCSNMCYYCASLTALTLNLPSATYCADMCGNCSSLTALTLNLPSATNCKRALDKCTNLTSLSFNFGSMSTVNFTSTSGSGGIGNVTTLQNVTVLEGGLASCTSFNISASTNLTATSIQNIIDALPNYSGTGTSALVTFPPDRLTAEQQTQITNKGWSWA